jgi:ketosteroid isomerase-like protein
MTRAAAMLTLFLSCIVSAGLRAASPEEAVIDMDRKLDEALLRADVPALERWYASDYVFVAVDGRIYDKQERIARARQQVAGDLWPKVTQRHARVYGDSAIVTSHIEATAASKRAMVSVRMFVRRNGEWKVVHTQVTAVAAHHGS